MSIHRSTANELPLDELVFSALSQLQVLQYNSRSIRRYQTVWRKLLSYAQQCNYKGKLREQLIVDFLAHYNIEPQLPVQANKGWKLHAEYGLSLLWSYARYGYFERGKLEVKRLNVPTAMRQSLQDYKTYCEEERHLRPITVEQHMREVVAFLNFLSKRGIKRFGQIGPEDLSDFVYSLSHYRRKTVAVTVSDVRGYLQYLFYKGMLSRDLSDCLPGVYFPEKSSIPSVWDKELLALLLEKVDRRLPRGKRDYAILLLAARLGLRSSDIRNLTLDQIDWAAETISFNQSKSGMPVQLPLTDEVGNALIHYLKHVRPNTHYREVFLKLQPPIKPFSKSNHLYNIIRYWRSVAGIRFRSPQKQGLHSLRHTLATQLLEDDVPFSLIANILGHASMTSTMIYAKASVESLREVALSIPEVENVNQA